MSSDEAIRQLFLSPEPFYLDLTAADLLSWDLEALRDAIEAGEVAAERTDGGYRISWEEVAGIMIADRPQAMIEEALGTSVAAALPELVRLAELRVRLPRFEVVMLERLAERDALPVEEVLARHLLDLAGAEGDWLGASVPGFAAAVRWPEA